MTLAGCVPSNRLEIRPPLPRGEARAPNSELWMRARMTYAGSGVLSLRKIQPPLPHAMPHGRVSITTDAPIHQNPWGQAALFNRCWRGCKGHGGAIVIDKDA